MPTYGQRPDDVVQDSRGNALRNVLIQFYATEALALAGGTAEGSVLTDARGRWSYVGDGTELWARMPDGTVWEIDSGESIGNLGDRVAVLEANPVPDVTAADLAAHAADSTAVHGITDTSALVVTTDPRLSDARTPTAHTHGVTDLTATGTADATTYLRGDNTWATPDAGGGSVASTDITDSTVVGRAVLTAATESAARAAISAPSTTHAFSHGSGQSDEVTLAQSQVTNLTADLAGKASTSHAHAGADITSGTVSASRLPTASTTASGVVELATSAETTTGTDTARATTPAGVKAVADTKAALSHTHAASDINSGTVATARLGSGTADSTTFLRGDQTWATPGGGSDPWTYVIATVDTDNDTTTSTNCTGLSLTGLADGLYVFEAFILGESVSSSTGVQVGVSSPASAPLTVFMWGFGASGSAQVFRGVASTETTATLVATSAGQGTPAIGPAALISGMFRAASMSTDTIDITVRSETAANMVSVKADSYIRYRRLSA